MATSLLVESWTWYGFVCLMITLRYIARLRLFKDVRKLQLEDWLMLFVFSLYTVLIIFLNICSSVSTNLINPSDIPNLTPEDIESRIWGSKCVLIVESMMCSVQWGTKACLVSLYFRLTEKLPQRLGVNAAAVYCAATYCVMMGLYYGYWCRPFRAFYAVPTPNIQCATQIHHLIVNLTFNLTSDLLIIIAPLPLFIRANLPIQKKLILVIPFSMGCFTIICAILSKHLSFTQPFSSEWLYWYTREASTAMIVTNMPYSWAIIRMLFNLKGFLSNEPRPTSHAYQMQSGRGVSHTSGPGTFRSAPVVAGTRFKRTFLSIIDKDGAEVTCGRASSRGDSMGHLYSAPQSFDIVDQSQGADTGDKSGSRSSSNSNRSSQLKELEHHPRPLSDADRVTPSAFNV